MLAKCLNMNVLSVFLFFLVFFVSSLISYLWRIDSIGMTNQALWAKNTNEALSNDASNFFSWGGEKTDWRIEEKEIWRERF